MILCVCLSPAVDVTYHVDRLVTGGTTRVTTVTERAGGKAVNVARVLHRLGEPVRLVAPAGDATGDELRRRLEDAGLPAVLVPTALPTRRTVTVVEDGGRATSLVEPATLGCWPALVETVRAALDDAGVLVVSGAVPRGVPEGGLGSLVAIGQARDARVVVDTHGPALLEALAAGVDVVKPNADELASICPGEEPAAAVRRLSQRYGATVVASLGADGVVAAGQHGTWEARPAGRVVGNPTGAGDALVAGLARALERDPDALADPEAALRDAVALSAAAVQSPEAGEVDPDHHAAQVAGVAVRALDGAR